MICLSLIYVTEAGIRCSLGQWACDASCAGIKLLKNPKKCNLMNSKNCLAKSLKSKILNFFLSFSVFLWGSENYKC